MDIIHNSFDIVHKSEKSDFDLFFTMIPLGRYVTIRRQTPEEEALTRKGKMKKNQKHNRVYMTLVAYSGANETQGRFFKGVKGTLRPGAILINRLTFFLFFLLTWIQIFAIFSRKKKETFSLICRWVKLYIVYIFESNGSRSRNPFIYDDRRFEKVIQSVTLIYGHTAASVSVGEIHATLNLHPCVWLYKIIGFD